MTTRNTSQVPLGAGTHQVESENPQITAVTVATPSTNEAQIHLPLGGPPSGAVTSTPWLAAKLVQAFFGIARRSFGLRALVVRAARGRRVDLKLGTRLEVLDH